MSIRRIVDATTTLTCTSFSPKATRLTMSIRAALSGFGFLRYSASSIAWSSGLFGRQYRATDEVTVEPGIPGTSSLLSSKRLVVYIRRKTVAHGVCRVNEKGKASLGRLCPRSIGTVVGLRRGSHVRSTRGRNVSVKARRERTRTE